MTLWTDDRIAYLRDQAPHRSASQIAADIGCTRNAVIGKTHRLNIALGKPAMEAPPPVVAPPPPPTPKSVAVAEIQRGKYKQTQPGKFQACCAACGVHSPETDWGSRGPKRAAAILRRLGWRLQGMGATTAWTCAACEGVVAPTPVARPIIVRPPVIVCEPANPKEIWELGDRDCCWPLGDPLTPEFRYCAEPKADKRYCAAHAALSRSAWTVSDRKENRPAKRSLGR